MSKCDWKFCVSAGLVAYLGALTHYYCIVFTVLISLCYAGYLLLNRRFADTLKYCISMGIAGIMSVITFPTMLKHMFSGDRGAEALGNLTNISDLWTRLKSFYNIIDRQMFGKMMGYFLIILVLTLLFRKMIFAYGKNTSQAKTSIAFSRECIAQCKNVSWEYLYRKDISAQQEKAQYKDTDCICLCSKSRWKIQSKFVECQNYNSLTVIDKEKVSAEQIKESAELIRSYIQTDDVIITLIDFVDPEAYINKLLAEMPEYTEYKDIGTHFYGTSYYLSSNTK